MPAGHPEGYIEGFANVYRDAAELIAARRAGRAPRPAAVALTPNVLDGARGVAFIEASVASSQNNGAWTSARIPRDLAPRPNPLPQKRKRGFDPARPSRAMFFLSSQLPPPDISLAGS